MQHFLNIDRVFRHDFLQMISVVIPTLDAAAHLRRCFQALLPAALSGVIREVIVADGGSRDGTLALADAAGARVVKAPRGRGSQLRAGAEAARGDWILFLHADTVLEPAWEAEAVSFIETTVLEKPQAAAFRFALDDQTRQARRLELIVAMRCQLFALPYGDQGLLIPKRLYRKIGGYTPAPLMEDVDMARKLGRRRLVLLRSRAITSAERFRREGYFARSMRNLSILFLYALRVPTPVLARLYG
jgi:rSAM/selenodomain-associated transferase 2